MLWFASVPVAAGGDAARGARDLPEGTDIGGSPTGPSCCGPGVFGGEILHEEPRDPRSVGFMEAMMEP
ncbi:hypothetical protein ACWGDE_07180 [Streptomyces sp. NPDC054956]